VEDTPCGICPAPTTVPEFAVTRYPVKAVKKAPRQESHLVLILESSGKYLLTKRPEGGLLSGLWQFPMLESEVSEEAEDTEDDAKLGTMLASYGTTENPTCRMLGTVKHVFSHLVWNLRVYVCSLSAETSTPDAGDGERWLTKDEITEAALPTGMRKAFGLLEEKGKKRAADGEPKDKAKAKKAKENAADQKPQKGIMEFFKKEN